MAVLFRRGIVCPGRSISGFPVKIPARMAVLSDARHPSLLLRHLGSAPSEGRAQIVAG